MFSNKNLKLKNTWFYGMNRTPLRYYCIAIFLPWTESNDCSCFFCLISFTIVFFTYGYENYTRTIQYLFVAAQPDSSQYFHTGTCTSDRSIFWLRLKWLRQSGCETHVENKKLSENVNDLSRTRTPPHILLEKMWHSERKNDPSHFSYISFLYWMYCI